MRIHLSEFLGCNTSALRRTLRQNVNNEFNKRMVIDKNDLRDELSKVDAIPYMISRLKELREINDDYDIVVSISNKGYVRFAMLFPITMEQYNNVMEKYAQKKKQYGFVVRRDEQFYDVLHNDIERLFDWVDMEIANSYQCYTSYDNNNLIREFEFTRVKRY